jgi:3-oxoacyl-[acyl-carrier-protein] synthase-3
MGSLAPITGVAIRGFAAGIPQQRQRSLECPAFKSVEDATRFQRTIGITERRIAVPEQCASDLCGHAASGLLQRLAWDPASVGLLVMVTQSADYLFPATAILLQAKLGLSTGCIAFDINLGCSAFPFGVAQVASTMRTLGVPRALLLIGDISSRSCNPLDPSSYPLFSDAGSAIALELDADAAPMYVDLHSDGTGAHAICVKSHGLAGRHPVTSRSLDVRPTGTDRHQRHDLNTRLEGADIFSFSTRRAPESIANVLRAAALAPEQIDHLVLHQANRLINDMVCRKAGFTATQALTSLERYGNTGSASIPVTLSVNGDAVRRPAQLLACGFGVGLSWGSLLFSIGAHTPLVLVESDARFRPELSIDFGGD